MVGWNRSKDISGTKINSLLLLIQYSKGKGAKKRLYYLCKCDCGKETEVRWEYIQSGEIKSCGCKMRDRRISIKRSTINKLFLLYKASAKKRGLLFEFNLEEFEEITQMPCEYCKDSPSNFKLSPNKITEKPYFYTGIDRVDNGKGYTKDNCVPCCKKCNFMKKNYSLEDFKTHIEKIYFNFTKKKSSTNE